MLAYLQLLRLPAVFTAMADIFLGFILTHGGFEPWDRFAGLLIASSCLYLAGMVFNDVFDVKQDTLERPNRPIPSGRVSIRSAALLGSVLMIAGVMAVNGAPKSSLPVAAGLILTILAYNAYLKRTPLGPLAMGACRFLNVMLGASDFPLQEQNSALVCEAGLGVYIVGVTWFARTEARQSSRWQLIGALFVICSGIGLLAWLVNVRPPSNWNTIVYLMLAMIATNLSLRAMSPISDPTPARVQPMIKLMLLSYVMLCATLVYWRTGDEQLALTTACLVIPPTLLGKIIPMT